MTELQLGLVGLGIVFVILVVIYNLVQERRARNLLKRAAPEADRRDPLFDESGQRLGVSAARQDTRRAEPELEQQSDFSSPTLPDLDDEPGGPDAFCDAVFELQFAEPVGGEILGQSLVALERMGHRPLRHFAVTVEGAQRLRVRPHESYRAVQLAVLLANRQGPLSEDEFSQLKAHAQALAERFDASLDAPEAKPVIERARALDSLCASLDSQVALTLLATERPWEAQDLSTAAEAAGFTGPENGVFVWLDPESQLVRFTLGRRDRRPVLGAQGLPLTELVLELDLPQAPPSLRPFSDLLGVAQQVAQALSARIVDDSGRDVQGGAEPIDAQLLGHLAALEQHGFAAGSERARRLFS